MKKHKLYSKSAKEFGTKLRNKSTYAEVQLWQYLKKGQIKFDFHRQQAIQNYIVDFYSPQLKLVIEIDGDSHYGKEKYDEERQKCIEALNIKFLRFTDMEIVHELPKVMNTIEKWIEMKLLK